MVVDSRPANPRADLGVATRTTGTGWNVEIKLGDRLICCRGQRDQKATLQGQQHALQSEKTRNTLTQQHRTNRDTAHQHKPNRTARSRCSSPPNHRQTYTSLTPRCVVEATSQPNNTPCPVPVGIQSPGDTTTTTDYCSAIHGPGEEKLCVEVCSWNRKREKALEKRCCCCCVLV